MTKTEVEEFLKGKGDFVQIDHLTRMIKTSKSSIPRDVLKFIYLKLSEIYEKKNMYAEAARMNDAAAAYAMKFSEKINYFVKEAELFIKAGQFDRADEAVRKSFSEASASERANIAFQIKEFYKKQAATYEKEVRRGNAMKIYEKLLNMKIADDERVEIKKRLLEMYEKLGKVREWMELSGGRFLAERKMRVE